MPSGVGGSAAAGSSAAAGDGVRRVTAGGPGCGGVSAAARRSGRQSSVVLAGASLYWRSSSASRPMPARRRTGRRCTGRPAWPPRPASRRGAGRGDLLGGQPLVLGVVSVAHGTSPLLSLGCRIPCPGPRVGAAGFRGRRLVHLPGRTGHRDPRVRFIRFSGDRAGCGGWQAPRSRRWCPPRRCASGLSSSSNSDRYRSSASRRSSVLACCSLGTLLYGAREPVVLDRLRMVDREQLGLRVEVLHRVTPRLHDAGDESVSGSQRLPPARR